jgi:hypothetical protein
MTPAPDQLLEFARRYTEAWCSQDPARVAENYAPDGSLTINDGAPSVGRAAITEAARSFMVAFPDMQVLMDDLVVQGDNTDYRCTLLGTNTGPGGTRCRVRISGFEDWTTGDDGFIAASLGHYDRAEYDRQLEHGEGVDGARIARRLRSPSAPSRFIAAPFLFRSVVARRSRSLLPARRGTEAAALHRGRAASRGSPRRDAEPL